MEIHYHNRRQLPPEDEAGAVFHATLDSLLAVSDFLSLNCPATPDTLGLMNAGRLARLPRGAILVNAARGSLVDEPALLAAIESGHLAGAGLDCFVTEPGGNPAFAAHENIVMMPHVGSATVQTRDAMGFKALDNLDAFFAGRTPPDLVRQ
jgi:lactate dehydrogenase-like 2-hydroxyacid dehydrogenase